MKYGDQLHRWPLIHRRQPDPAARSGFVFQRGFTLLEICIVLFIIALLLGSMTPALESELIQQSVENDSHRLSLMVRTAMLQSRLEHRPYVMALTATSICLHPAGKPLDSWDAETPSSGDKAVEITQRFEQPNSLVVTDPHKSDDWLPMPDASWLFQPGELCPARPVRIARGKAWVELTFNALTGDVESEAAYFP